MVLADALALGAVAQARVVGWAREAPALAVQRLAPEARCLAPRAAMEPWVAQAVLEPAAPADLDREA